MVSSQSPEKCISIHPHGDIGLWVRCEDDNEDDDKNNYDEGRGGTRFVTYITLRGSVVSMSIPSD